MPLTASAGLITHLSQRTTTLALLWLITRTDGTVFAFTSHDADIEIDGVTYVAAYGITPSALQAGVGLSVGNAEVKQVFYAQGMTEADLRAGVWDHAEVRVRMVNWANLAQGVIKLLRGWLGEATHDGFCFTAELRGLADLLNRGVGEIVSPMCSATFGDARCGVSLTDWTLSGTVTSVTDHRVFSDADGIGGSDLEAGIYIGGLVTWTTGNNAGRSMEVKTNSADGEIELFLPMEGEIQVGDTFTIVRGCPKTSTACKEIFDNLLNFRGFPEVPGTDRYVRAGGQ